MSTATATAGIAEAADVERVDGYTLAPAEVMGQELPVVDEPLVDDELLVEDVSIDGMCGVY